MLGKPVVNATVKDDKIVISWLVSTWDVWKDIEESTELTVLMTTANEKLQQAAEQQSTVKGKGEGQAI